MGLSVRQSKFIQAYLKEGIILRACDEVGISKGTFYNWIKNNEDFRKRFDEIRDRLEKELFEKVNSLIPKAFEVLERELNNENSNIRLRAVSILLDVYHKQKELKIEERLEKIEEALDEIKR